MLVKFQFMPTFIFHRNLILKLKPPAFALGKLRTPVVSNQEIHFWLREEFEELIRPNPFEILLE